MLKLFIALAALAGFAEVERSDFYAEGQVWEYRTRPGEEGSLLKIQRIESYPSSRTDETRRVYHISIIGVRVGPTAQGALPHLPVSRETLDNSVIRRSNSAVAFPRVDDGVEIWRRDQGGVFTLSVADIVGAVDQMLGQVPR